MVLKWVISSALLRAHWIEQVLQVRSMTTVAINVTDNKVINEIAKILLVSTF